VDVLAVVGVGLLGGSVAAAARARGLPGRIVGAGRRPEPLERALAAGVVDAIATPAEAVAEADLVVLACPVAAMAPLVESLAPHWRPGALVTDVGSVKQGVVESLPGLLPAGVEFVGAHPMAGSHLRGVEHADAKLFEGACCVVTPGPGTSPAARQRVRDFWSALGARVVERRADVHDAQVAWVSHLPHALAFAYAHALAESSPEAGALAGPGFRDFTRIARSDAELWAEILLENGKPLAETLSAAGRHLERLATAIGRGDADAVERFLARARDHLAALEGARAAAHEERDRTAGE